MLAKFLFCGLCGPKKRTSERRQVIKSRSSSIHSAHSITSSTQRMQKQSSASSTQNIETTGILHVQKVGSSHEDILEWHKSVVTLNIGGIEITDLENDISDKFDLRGYVVSVKQQGAYIQISHPKSAVSFRFEVRDQGTSWVQFRGRIIFSNGINMEQWTEQFNRNIAIANKSRHRRNYTGPYHAHVSASGE